VELSDDVTVASLVGAVTGTVAGESALDAVTPISAGEGYFLRDPDDDVRVAEVVPGEHLCGDVTDTSPTVSDDDDWSDDVSDDVEEEFPSSCCFSSFFSSSCSVEDDDDDDEADDDFVVFSTFSTTLLPSAAGLLATEDADEEAEEHDDDEEEVDDDAELLEHDDALRLVVSAATVRASHSLTSTSPTTNESGSNRSSMTVSGDSWVMRHVGIVVTLSTMMLMVDSLAQSGAK